MKKRYMAISAAVMAGMIIAGGAGAVSDKGTGVGESTRPGFGTLSVLAKEEEKEDAKKGTEEETGGIRAKAPQGSTKGESAGQEESVNDKQEPNADAEALKNESSDAKTAEIPAVKLSAEEQTAKDAALADAELTLEELTGFRIKQDRDDGRTIFEIELYVDAEEYSYEIDAETFEILESDYEREEDYEKAPRDPDALTKEEVSQIVLDKVEGATEMDLRIKYEYDDGKELYEGDIVYGGTEYEFEVSSKDGQILEWSEEKY